MLHDKGLFEYDDCISKHWPEFGQNGKEEIKISDVCQHRAGLANFSEAPSIKDAWTENIKKDQMSSLIEKLKPHYPQHLEKHGSKCDYHAITRGWITNEIIRRVDPKHRTMHEIFKEEVNIDGIHITVDEEAAEKLVPETFITNGFVFGQLMLPKWAGRKIEPNLISYAKMIGKLIFMDNIKYLALSMISYCSFYGKTRTRRTQMACNGQGIRRQEFHSRFG